MKALDLSIIIHCDCLNLLVAEFPVDKPKSKFIHSDFFVCRNCGVKYFFHVQQSALQDTSNDVKQTAKEKNNDQES